jgi:hypothetical protein
MNNVPDAPPPWSQPLPPQPLAARWPTAIGLASLIIGIGSIVGAAIQAISLGFLYYQRMSSSSGLRGYMIGQSVTAVATLICGVLLVIAAILLLRRRPITRAMHYAYAIVSLASALLIIASDLMFGASSLSSSLFGITRLLQAYPIFCLIWFSRADVRFDIQEMGEPPTET